MARFITLAGRKQVGKDTSAQYIKQMLESNGVSPKRIHIVHFADALKRACIEIFGIEESDLETETGKQKKTDVRWPYQRTLAKDDVGGRHEVSEWLPDEGGKLMTVREILQFVGTNLFRNQMDPDVWVKSVYRKKYRDEDIVIVADCRFPNEAQFAKDNGVLISIERNNGLAVDGHASETALDDYSDYHYVVDNNGSFAELRMHLEAILIQNQFVKSAV